jgi:hypothetical protein
VKLVLDANALWHRPLALALAEARDSGAMDRGAVEAVLPAIAYAERVRQLRRDGRDVDLWKEQLRRLGLRIEPFGEGEAERVPVEALDDAAWATHARDLLIAAHAAPDRDVVTSDRGHAWKGVRRMTPDEATAALRDLLSA